MSLENIHTSSFRPSIDQIFGRHSKVEEGMTGEDTGAVQILGTKTENKPPEIVISEYQDIDAENERAKIGERTSVIEDAIKNKSTADIADVGASAKDVVTLKNQYDDLDAACKNLDSQIKNASSKEEKAQLKAKLKEMKGLRDDAKGQFTQVKNAVNKYCHKNGITDVQSFGGRDGNSSRIEEYTGGTRFHGKEAINNAEKFGIDVEKDGWTLSKNQDTLERTNPQTGQNEYIAVSQNDKGETNLVHSQWMNNDNGEPELRSTVLTMGGRNKLDDANKWEMPSADTINGGGDVAANLNSDQLKSMREDLLKNAANDENRTQSLKDEDIKTLVENGMSVEDVLNYSNGAFKNINSESLSNLLSSIDERDAQSNNTTTLSSFQTLTQEPEHNYNHDRAVDFINKRLGVQDGKFF